MTVEKLETMRTGKRRNYLKKGKYEFVLVTIKSEVHGDRFSNKNLTFQPLIRC